MREESLVAMTHQRASVAVAVAAPDRAEAFEAVRYAIDRLKAVAPIWKKQVWEGGHEWIEEEGT